MTNEEPGLVDPNDEAVDEGYEPVNVGIGSAAHRRLQRLKDDGYFAELMDGYRFAVGLAIAHGGATTEFRERKNMFNVGSLDPDKRLYYAVSALRRPDALPVYKTMEQLATWGVNELDRRASEGTLSFSDILAAAGDLTVAGEDEES